MKWVHIVENSTVHKILKLKYSEKANKIWRNLQILFTTIFKERLICFFDKNKQYLPNFVEEGGGGNRASRFGSYGPASCILQSYWINM